MLFRSMHCVARIQQHIQHHLLQLAFVPMDVRKIGVQLGLDPDPIGLELVVEQRQGVGGMREVSAIASSCF